MIVVVLAGLWTAGWSRRGFQSGVRDTPERWALAKMTVTSHSTVVVGTSRSLSALDPSVWKVTSGHPLIHLGLLGVSPEQTLDLLAHDPSFVGTVLVDFAPYWIFNLRRNARLGNQNFAAAQDAWKTLQSSPSRRWEGWLRRRAPRLPLRHPDLNWPGLLSAALRGRLPRVPNSTARDDRFHAHRFSPRNPFSKDLRDTYLNEGADDTVAERDSILAGLREDVNAIHLRGGKVVFLLIPTCGEVRDLEEIRYPRVDYWEVARQTIDAVFLDDTDPALDREWRCADLDHLDEHDVPAYTRAVAERTQAMIDPVDPQRP